MGDEEHVAIASDADIVTARQRGRAVAARMGFSSIDLALIATAISELARNIVRYAGRGEIHLALLNDGGREGVQVVASDSGPGIPDIGLAMQGGFSTSGSLGLGLPGVRRLMDEMEIHSEVGKGTTVKARKWKR
ncbi:MAG: anti-sigma regulatory factor [Candidatus Polarisedimenticolia bacterium]